MIYIKHQMFDVDSINVKQMEYIITFDNLEYEEEFFMNREELKATADRLRLVAVDMVYRGKDGHPGPALSIADIVATLFFDKMRIDPKNPGWGRQRPLHPFKRTCMSDLLCSPVRERIFRREGR